LDYLDISGTFKSMYIINKYENKAHINKVLKRAIKVVQFL